MKLIFFAGEIFGAMISIVLLGLFRGFPMGLGGGNSRLVIDYLPLMGVVGRVGLVGPV
jgi:hypothetical protein